jgi:hypothetical protein
MHLSSVFFKYAILHPSLFIYISNPFQVMIRSLDQDTRSNYSAGLLHFTQFCDSMDVPETLRMPASEALLSQFIAAFAGITASKTLNN